MRFAIIPLSDGYRTIQGNLDNAILPDNAEMFDSESDFNSRLDTLQR